MEAATKELIYEFVLWASERRNPDETSAEAIKADTIRKYEKKPVLISHRKNDTKTKRPF